MRSAVERNVPVVLTLVDSGGTLKGMGGYLYFGGLLFRAFRFEFFVASRLLHVPVP